MLEGSGDLKIGLTGIQECQVVLAPHGVLIRKYYELSPGKTLDVQFTLAENEFTWKGEAIFYEEIRSELLKAKQIVTNFHFSLPHNDSRVTCNATIFLQELNITVSLQQWFEEISADALNNCLHKLKKMLVENLLEDLRITEIKFAEIQMDGSDENGYANTYYTPVKDTHQPNEQPVKQPGVFSGNIKGYVKGYVQQRSAPVRKQDNDTYPRNTRAGYLPSKKPATSLKGYLNTQHKTSQSFNGYIQKMKWNDERERPAVPAPKGNGLLHGQTNGIPERQGISLNYSEIEKYAGRILYLKEMLRGLDEIKS